MATVAALCASGLLLLWAFRRSHDGAAGDVADMGDWSQWSPGSALDDVTAAADSVIGSTLDMADDLTGGLVRVSRMRNVTAADLADSNVQAMLRVIRRGEGTADANGYRRIFGGGLFDSFADHPRQKVSRSGYVSTAAGAYQFTVSTWDETRRVMGLADFSPESQDIAAVGRIMARGALDDVRAGRFSLALRKLGREWASLPGSPYGQPTISEATAQSVFLAAGGEMAIGGNIA